MVSILSLYNGPPSLALPRVPFTTLHGTHNLQFGPNHGFYLSKFGNAHRPTRHALQIHPVICGLKGSWVPSRNYENGDGIAKGVLGSSLVLACAVGLFSAYLKMNTKAIAFEQLPPPAKAETQTQDKTQPLKESLASFLDVPYYLITLKDAPRRWFYYKVPVDPPDVFGVKTYAIKVLKHKSVKDVEDLLTDAREKYKEQPDALYEVEMVLVEILISLRRYEEALKCNCLNDNNDSKPDPRISFYKFIIYTMLDNKEKSVEYLEKYREMVYNCNTMSMVPSQTQRNTDSTKR